MKYDNKLYGATDGGIFIYDFSNQVFEEYESNYKDICINIADIESDDNDLWVLCGNGALYKNSSNLIVSHLIDDIDSAVEFIISDQGLIFMIYESNNVYGLMQFSYNEDQLIYNDYYKGFTSNINSEFIKIMFNNNILYVLTDEGIYYGNISDNLKFPENWYFVNQTLGVLGFDILDGLMTLFYDSGYVAIVNPFDPTSLINTIQFQQVFLGEYIDVYTDTYNKTIYILYSEGVRSLNYNNLPFNASNIEISGVDFSDALSIYADSASVYIGMKNQGFWEISDSNIINKCSPNTLASQDVDALTFQDGVLYGVNRSGVFIYKDESFTNLISNSPQPNFQTDSFYECNSFNGLDLNYMSAEKSYLSLMIHDNILYIPSNGIMPSASNRGGAIMIDVENYQILDIIGLPVFDGMAGIYDNQDSDYMTINQVIKDDSTNIWFVNPYAENTQRILVYKSLENNEWKYIVAPDEVSYVPREVAFDRWGRIWVSFQFLSTNTPDANLYSNGGLKLLGDSNNGFICKEGDINYGNDQYCWFDIENLESLPGLDPNVSIWSIAFAKFGANDILWVLSSNGVQGYNITGLRIDPIYPLDFFNNLPFSEGDKVRVDAQNNVWIITSHSGVRVIKNDLSFWPDQFGVTTSNSDILSNNVKDVTFDNDNGLAFLATDNGVSILEIPFQNNKKNSEVGVSPNPFIVGQHDNFLIEDMYAGSIIKIMTISGEVLKKIELPYNENRINWDGRQKNGDYIDSGVYFLVVENNKHGNGITKIAVIR
ncbi:MAG: hypothetical protein CMG00_03565 [Candidatus Marinimicrobia bacterium]|nr:hypothetical protein [Candidatus Neomarinimicrobiota bacterium]